MCDSGADENGTVARVTKTKAGYRTIALPADLIQLLREWKMEAGGHALVFATKHGKPVSLANITRHGWYPVQLAVGTDHNFHSLRHFHASMLIADGANPKDVQVEIGHANIQFTYNRYGHLFQDDEANRRRSERSERMASLLSPVRGI